MEEKSAFSPSSSSSQLESKREVKEGRVDSIEEGSPLRKPQSSSVFINMISSPPKINEDEESIDYQHRGQWLRAAVLGANDGLVTTASLMMGVGAVKTDARTMIMSGLAALVAGACSMAIGEYVSVHTQRDVELANLKREKQALKTRVRMNTMSPLVISREEKEGLPSPIQAACASALAFAVGAFLPLISTAFISDYIIRVSVLAGVSSFALIMFGAIGAHFGRSSIVKGTVRVLIGGWFGMLVTYGLLRLFSATAGV